MEARISFTPPAILPPWEEPPLTIDWEIWWRQEQDIKIRVKE
jgi:hypothetical protein